MKDDVDLTAGTVDEATSNDTVTTKPVKEDKESYVSDTYEDTEINTDTTTATFDTDTPPDTDNFLITDPTTETVIETTKKPESYETKPQGSSNTTYNTEREKPKETETGAVTTQGDVQKYAKSVPVFIPSYIAGL
ncbi:MAG: hypothetical protein WBI55_01645 [Eubacteriales bacterium]|jgi:hypothetical protein